MRAYRQTIKRLFPAATDLAAGYRRVRRSVRQFRLSRRVRRQIFTEYFKGNQWADADSRSGAGSNLKETLQVRQFLPEIIEEYCIRSLVDVPCGDFFWLRHVDLDGAHYTGCDIVDQMIAANQKEFGTEERRFMSLDLCVDTPPAADLVLCRDGLVHFSNRDALAAIANLRRSGATYLLTTSFPDISGNIDIATGMWRPINLTLPPFDFSEPLRVVVEPYEGHPHRYGDKILGLWLLNELHSPADGGGGMQLS